MFKENTNPNDLQRISSQIQNLVDEWQSQGKIMWSGVFIDMLQEWQSLMQQSKR